MPEIINPDPNHKDFNTFTYTKAPASEETTLWTGRPDGRVQWHQLQPSQIVSGVLLCLFGLAFGLLIAPALAPFSMGGFPPIFMRLIALFFFLGGLVFLGGGLVLKARHLRKLDYILTDKAAYISKPGTSPRAYKRFPIHSGSHLSLDEKTRAVRFRKARKSRRSGSERHQSFHYEAFEELEGAADVYARIRALMGQPT